MAYALARVISQGRLAESIVVFDQRPERMDLFVRDFQAVRAAENCAEVVDTCDALFLAVKPQDIDTVLKEITGTDRLIISIAAGITLEHLEASLAEARVVRVMPNTPCLVGQMASAYAAGRRVRPPDRKRVEALLGAAGYTVALEEELLDAVTGLSGSGPAFVALLIEAFIEAGVLQGLSREVARNLSLKTFLGTALLLEERQMHPEELVAMVSSPKGTTVAGRAVLEASEYRRILSNTIGAAAARSKELGRR